MVDPPKKSSPLRLFSDEPVSKDQLGSHDAIAQTLLDIITTDGKEDYHIKRPFVIGLYGKWGSGKSSIIKMLENKIKNIDQLRIAIVDAWSVGPKNFPRHILRSTAEAVISDQNKLNKIISEISEEEIIEKSGWEIEEELEGKLERYKWSAGISFIVLITIAILNEVCKWPIPIEIIATGIFAFFTIYFVHYLLPKYTKIINKSSRDLFLDDPSYFREELSKILNSGG